MLAQDKDSLNPEPRMIIQTVQGDVEIGNSCECRFRDDCHIPRQFTQKLFRERDPNYTIQDCDFYKLLNEMAR